MSNQGSDQPVPTPPWIDDVRRRIADRWPDLIGQAWVVAVSGGGDSVGLLLALHAIAPFLELRLSVAHLNHGVRGEAAEVDAAFVADLATRLGLSVDLGHWQPSRAGHFEADARRARLAWLLQVARGRGAQAVALGHNADDQAETILHRILRGTGLRGLAGIPAWRPLAEDDGPPVVLVRPLLAITRAEIRDGLASIGQPYREDPTNADTSRTRSRIRHDLMPCLADQYNPRVAEAIARLGRLAAGSRRVLESCLDALDTGIILAANPDRVELDRGRLAALPPPLRVELLRRAWRMAEWPEVGMTARRWQRLADLASHTDPPARDIGHGVRFRISRNLVLERLQICNPGEEERKPPAPIALHVPGAVTWGGQTIVAAIDPDEPADELADLDRIIPPVQVRSPLAGDRFEPLGMAGRGMALADFLRGCKVPRADRPFVPIVCDAAGILWVVGHRIADRVKVTERTIRTLALRRAEASSPQIEGPPANPPGH